MKNKFLCILLSFSQLMYAQTWPSFDDSMQLATYHHIVSSPQNMERLGISGEHLLEFFRFLYDLNHPAYRKPSPKVRIPKIIHQIWIGKEVPKEFESYQQSIRTLHPGWEYKLWTQNDIPSLHLQNEEFVQLSRNPGEISDLMRYEILYRYGGVYMDFDCECLKSLEQLHYMYDFYIGIQPLDSELVQLGIGIIGSVPNHPILKTCIECVKDNWKNKTLEYQAVARTGPIYCTKIFLKTAGRNDLIDIALPASYFYPLGSKEFALKKKQWLDFGAFAVHHWAKSWLYPTFRRAEFQGIKNY